MNNDINQPKELDAVLGGETPPPVNAVVLGGIEGVKHRFNSANAEVQIAALSEAFNYGEVCLDVINQALQSPSALVRISAYSLLKSRSETWAKQAINDLGSYELFKCDRTLDTGFRYISSIAISLDSKMLVCGGGQNWQNPIPIPTVWNLRTGEQLLIPNSPHLSDISWVAISPDGQRIISLSRDSKILVWDVETGEQIYNLKREPNSDSRIAIHPDGKTFFMAGIHGAIKILNLQSGQEIGRLEGHRGKTIRDLCITASGKLLISGDYTGNIKVWDINSKLQVREFGKYSHDIKSFAISPDEQTLVNGSNQRIKVWDLQKGQEKFSFYGNAGWISSMVFISDNKTFFSAGDTNIKMWNAFTGKKIYSFKAHSQPINSLALSADGQTLVSGNSDGTVKVWSF